MNQQTEIDIRSDDGMKTNWGFHSIFISFFSPSSAWAG